MVVNSAGTNASTGAHFQSRLGGLREGGELRKGGLAEKCMGHKFYGNIRFKSRESVHIFRRCIGNPQAQKCFQRSLVFVAGSGAEPQQSKI